MSEITYEVTLVEHEDPETGESLGATPNDDDVRTAIIVGLARYGFDFEAVDVERR